MISYELAKKLKDAGFKQRKGVTAKELLRYGNAPVYLCEHKNNCGNAYDCPTSIFIPTLSELIEACGLPFGLDCNVKGYWYARQAHHSESIHTDFCSTPDEAVGNLWIGLNRPQ